MAIEHTIYASPGLPVDGARRLLGIDGNGDLTLNGGGAGPLEVTPTGSSTPRTLADWMAGMTGLGVGSAAAPSVAFQGNTDTGLFYRSATYDYIGFASSGKQAALLGYRLLNSVQDNAQLYMGTSQAITASANEWYLATIQAATINDQSGNSSIIGMNIGILDVNATDQVTKTLAQYNIELDKFEITQSGGAVTYSKVGNTRVRLPIAKTGVTITQSVGITFLVPTTVTGTITDVKAILFPPLTAGGATNYWGMFFENQPNKGMIGTASGVDLLLTAGTVGGAATNMIFRTEVAGSYMSFRIDAQKEILRLGAVGSNGNYVRIDANNNPLIYSQGSATNIALTFATKGTGAFSFGTNGNADKQFSIAANASAVNYLEVAGGPTGAPGTVILRAQGTDANVDVAIQTLGTGVLRYGTHSAIAAETVTGYITIKDASGNTRKLAVVS